MAECSGSCSGWVVRKASIHPTPAHKAHTINVRPVEIKISPSPTIGETKLHNKNPDAPISAEAVPAWSLASNMAIEVVAVKLMPVANSSAMSSPSNT